MIIIYDQKPVKHSDHHDLNSLCKPVALKDRPYSTWLLKLRSVKARKKKEKEGVDFGCRWFEVLNVICLYTVTI